MCKVEAGRIDSYISISREGERGNPSLGKYAFSLLPTT